MRGDRSVLLCVVCSVCWAYKEYNKIISGI